MPRGLNRQGDYRNGTPITLPHIFGTPITLPHEFGNIPPFDPGNLVDWAPSPAHFGNQIGSNGGYLLQADGVSRFILGNGSGFILVS
jgi:hypothetical protein